MGERQALSSQTKKLLVLVFVGVVLLAAAAGFYWPDSDPKTVSAPTGDDTVSSTSDNGGASTDGASSTEEEDRQSLADENDKLLTETYGLELPVTIRARDMILETHQLLVDFERTKEETNEFADPSRYSCQQFQDATNLLGSGPGSELPGIFARILESGIGLEVIETADDEQDNEIRTVGDLSDLELDEITAIAGMVQSLNDINNDFAATEARLADCGLSADELLVFGSESTSGDVSAPILNPVTVPDAQQSQRDSARSADISRIAYAVNLYVANRNLLPADRGEISSRSLILEHYVLDQINAVGSWDGATLPADGDFSWDEGYNDPPSSQSALGREDSYDNLLVAIQASCDGNILQAGSIRQVAIVYRLEGQDDPLCLEV